MIKLRRLLALWFALPLLAAQSAPPLSRDSVKDSLRKAATYYRSKVASHGGYVYYSSLDLQERWGEGKASADQIWVQPPGTPTVGMAFLSAFASTGEALYLDAAREAGEALVYGQLMSGGWTHMIDFKPQGAKRIGKYRGTGGQGSWNASSLDDDQTPSALRLLIRLDRALAFKHAAIHEAADYGLTALLAAQFPNGAFPQVWTGPVAAQPLLKASYPDYDWKTEGRVKTYWDLYTLNDNLPGAVARILIEASEIYAQPKYAEALERLGDFLIAAQMPDPQPAWAQQYDYAMHPVWARKFEPPAVTGWESQDAMETLIRIYRRTGKEKYFEPVPRALDYLKKSLLPDGRLARFYELKTNKPLYMDARYQLTYDDSAAPAHYGWKQPSRLADIEKEIADARAGKAAAVRRPAAAELEAEARKILAALDDQGRWISTHDGERLVGQPKFKVGFQYLGSQVFSRNLELLSDYLQAK